MILGNSFLIRDCTHTFWRLHHMHSECLAEELPLAPWGAALCPWNPEALWWNLLTRLPGRMQLFHQETLGGGCDLDTKSMVFGPWPAARLAEELWPNKLREVITKSYISVIFNIKCQDQIAYQWVLSIFRMLLGHLKLALLHSSSWRRSRDPLQIDYLIALQF